MDKRFVQAHKEALWALILTFIYLLGWLITAYLPDNTLGITGLPVWFELSCLFLPVLFFFVVLSDGALLFQRYAVRR
ncbi:hypothetical protein BN1805_02299 [Proteus vulgaris]|nr:hypothetical protein BN1805_02299 [Proteus vulgaris]